MPRKSNRQTSNIKTTSSSFKLNNSLSKKTRKNSPYKDGRRHNHPEPEKIPDGFLAKRFYKLKKFVFSKKGLKYIGISSGVFLILMVIFFSYVLVSLQKDLPAISSLYGKNLSGSISYYNHTGKVLLWNDYNGIDRIPVATNQQSPFIRDATVAIEDKSFYTSGPIDYLAILRAAVHDALGGSLEGASTITMQLVKLNENWNGQVTILRKIKEVFLAYDVSQKYSKSTILTGYLNIAPYGGINYGVQAAAENYFRENASQLSLAQSAFLAAIPQSPSYYSPYAPYFSKSALIGRMDYILKLMHQQGYITLAQEQQALKVNVLSQVQPEEGLYTNIKAPYFVLSAQQQLQSMFGSKSYNEGGWKVITSLHVSQQNEANKLVQQDYPAIKAKNGDDAAMVVENVPTGQVTAQIGGVNFFNPVYGQLNFATSRINPGSTFKIYDYTTLINDETDVGAGSVLYDSQGPLPGYPCTNKALPSNGGNCLWDYDYQYPGPLPIRYAFAGSRNVPAIKAALIVGIPKVQAMAKSMGLTSGYKCYANTARTIPAPCYASSMIGEGGYLKLNQTVNGFATDSRLGNYVPQTYILQVKNANNQTIYQWKQPKPKQVVKPDAAYIIDNILSDPNATYLPGYCGPINCTPLSSFGFKFQHTNGWDVAVKTGTTHGNFTGLMIGMTTQYAVGSWVGYHTAQVPIIESNGGLEALTEPLTRGMITYLTNGKKPINWKQPPGIKLLPAYVLNNPPAPVLGHYYGWVYPSPSTDLYPSWYNPPKIANGKTYNVDVVSGDLATSCTPPLAVRTISINNNANIFSIDPFVKNGSTNYAGQYNLTVYDNIHQCSNAKPTVSIVPNSITCTTTSCNFNIDVKQGTYPLSSSKFPFQTHAYINGKAVTVSCNFSPGIGGATSPASTVGNCTVPDSTANGSQQLTVEVVDSVLYSNTSSAVSLPAPANNSTGPTTPTAAASPNSKKHKFSITI